MRLVAGVDEVGRGTLAGPVVAAAVILDPKNQILGLKDSKLLTPKQRVILCELIKSRALAWGVGLASVEEIDQFNILQASLLAMERAVNSLALKPEQVKVDGRFLPKVNCAALAIIGGDRLVPEISAASIIAKVARDQKMQSYEQLYPNYGFAEHKGYGTAKHLLALKQQGVTPIHRRSFAPVRLCLCQPNLSI